MKPSKGSGYALTAALMLALPQLILALPDTAAPFDPKGVSVPARVCPTPPNRPIPAPVPTASATATQASDRDGRGLPGAILLAFGGLLVAVWAFLGIRKPV